MLKIILLMLLSFGVLADDVLLEWDIPTQRVDGATLNPEEIDGYTIKHQIGKDAQDDIKVDGGLTLSHAIAGISTGVHLFSIATVSDGVTGPYSNSIPITISEKSIAAPQAPPTVIRVQLNCDNCQYEIAQ